MMGSKDTKSAASPISPGQGQLAFEDQDLFEHFEDSVETGITEDTAKASVDALLASASRYSTPSEYRDLVAFVGKLPRYSPFNRMLVHIQDPGAKYVATAARWRSEFGREITPGARPIIVLQPMGPVLIVFDVRHTEAVGPNPRPVPTSATDPIAIGYRAPETEIETRWSRIEHNAIRDGIRISLVDHGAHAGGSTTSRLSSGIMLSRPSRARDAAGRPEKFPLRYDVEVNGTLRRRDQYATLVHELAHIYCGHLGSPNEKNWPSRPRTPHDVEEVEAESVVHMIVSRVDPGVVMGDYIQGHLDKAGVPPGVSLNAMTKAAGLIEDMGDSWLPARKHGRG
ncbi:MULTISPECIES: hypothetical protein [unclassified Isoptericola]|uniref:hypothetical protein n=1 Tax=unclassified Isoptericola TaxID=2623355 RepID=UPI00365A760E